MEYVLIFCAFLRRMAKMNKLNVVVFDLYLICKGNLGSCDVVIKVSGFLVPADCIQYI